MPPSSSLFNSTLALFAVAALAACSSDGPTDAGSGGTGGAAASGGGTATGGASGGASGGMTSGGATGGGGTATGGTGTASGGTGGGGTATGGTGGGGTSSGGTATGGGGGTGGAATGGGGGTGGASACFDPYAAEGYEPTFTNVKWMMDYSPNGPCAASDCHGVNDVHPEKLVLEDDAGLLERMKTHVAHRCNDLTVVVPGDPENSAMVRALRGECSDAEGKPLFRMPGNCNTDLDCNCFYPSWMETVEAWILAGALDN